MHRGKVICKELKEVRRRIADENDIPLEIKECTYEGPCRGTCPRCEAEVRYLERELARRISVGKAATVAGLALGLASCGNGASGNAPDTDDVIYTGEPLPPIEETDTAQHHACNAKHVWRAPDDSDLYVGGFEVMPLTTPDSDADIEVGGEDDEDALLGMFDGRDPEYPGGMEAMYRFIQDNLKYPQLALESGIQGKVYLTFVVEEDGSVSNVRVLRDIGGGCGAEAKRVVEMMPKWKPGNQRGKAVRSQYNLPVNFILPKDRPRLIEGGPAETIWQESRIQGMPIDTSNYDVSPNAPTQQMEVEGVKVIVR